MFKRIQNFINIGKESCFLWGPRQSGKSTFLKSTFPHARYYDLLLPNEFMRLSRNPELIREELAANPVKGPVIIDEVQKVPLLLDVIQWLIVNQDTAFILCGSSARKLKRGGGNLLGGRALRYEMFPLVSREIPDFDLLRALNHGLLPRHYLSDAPRKLLEAYVGEYLKEEIAAESLVRNLPAFQRFLEVAALSHGELVNYQNIASECGVSSPTVKGYFEILQDTLIGRFIPTYRKRPKRRVVLTPKFYFFDVGLVNYLLKSGPLVTGSESFGRAFEHFILQEILAHRHYSGLEYPLSYWRTTSQLEVDFILGEGEVALEIKGTAEVKPHHLKGLRAFQEEYRPKKSLVISQDSRPRLIEGIHILPWKEFLDRLWGGEIIG